MVRLFAICITALFFAFPPAVHAQQVDSVHKDWTVFTLNQKGQKVCYIASSPISKTGNYKKRGEPYMLVTHRSATSDEVSVSSGYPYKIGGEVLLTRDGHEKFSLFTTTEVPKVAWARSTEDDKKIIDSMVRGLKIQVKGFSRLGTYSLDTYSLLGFSDAYKRMKVLCK